jgi:hypothetical protein
MTSNVIDMSNAAYDKARFDLDSFDVKYHDNSIANVTTRLAALSHDNAMRDMSDTDALAYLDKLKARVSHAYMNALYRELNA